MRREIPAQWRSLMERKGLTSLRRLAEASNVSPPVVARMVYGDGASKDESVILVAKALGQPPSYIYDLLGAAAPAGAGEWVPPAESARLTKAQRDALSALIRTMVPADSTGLSSEGSHLYDLAAHPVLDTVEARERKASDGRGEESQEYGDES